MHPTRPHWPGLVRRTISVRGRPSCDGVPSRSKYPANNSFGYRKHHQQHTGYRIVRRVLYSTCASEGER